MDMAWPFNGREGFTAKEDRMPPCFIARFQSGPLVGSQVDEDYLDSMKRRDYHIVRWEVDAGIPTRARLEGMEDRMGGGRVDGMSCPIEGALCRNGAMSRSEDG